VADDLPKLQRNLRLASTLCGRHVTSPQRLRLFLGCAWGHSPSCPNVAFTQTMAILPSEEYSYFPGVSPFFISRECFRSCARADRVSIYPHTPFCSSPLVLPRSPVCCICVGDSPGTCPPTPFYSRRAPPVYIGRFGEPRRFGWSPTLLGPLLSERSRPLPSIFFPR